LKTFSGKLAAPLFAIQLTEPAPRPLPEQGEYLLTKFDFDHPLFSPYKGFSKEEIPEVKFYSHATVRETSAATVLARFSDNSPAVVEATTEKGRALLCTFSLAEDYSDLTAHPLMVVLLNRSVEYLVSEPLNQREQIFAGESVTRVLTTLSDKEFALVSPDDDTVRLSPSFQSGEIVFNLGRLEDPGIYRLLGEDHTIDLFAVNFPPEESELSSIPPAELAEKIAGCSLVILSEESDPAPLIAGARFGKELWKLFLFLAFFFLLLEMAVAASGRQPEAGSS
jgi:hypothetical protein